MFYEYVEHNFKDRCRFLNYLLLHRRQVQAICAASWSHPDGRYRVMEASSSLLLRNWQDIHSTADEIAEAIVFMVADRASFIYGAKFAVA